MVRCMRTGKLEMSRKQTSHALRKHATGACPRCRSGWYRLERYQCPYGDHRHVGHRWIGVIEDAS